MLFSKNIKDAVKVYGEYTVDNEDEQETYYGFYTVKYGTIYSFTTDDGETFDACCATIEDLIGLECEPIE